MCDVITCHVISCELLSSNDYRLQDLGELKYLYHSRDKNEAFQEFYTTDGGVCIFVCVNVCLCVCARVSVCVSVCVQC